MPKIIEITDFSAEQLDIYARSCFIFMNRRWGFLLRKAQR